MVPPSTVHLVSPLKQLEVAVMRAGLQVIGFGGIEEYLRSFCGASSVFDRPELLIVDVSTPPSAVDRRKLIARVRRSHPEQEILALVEAWRTDRIGYLVQHGIGNLLPGAFRAPSDRTEYVGRLLKEARRLLEVASERRTAQGLLNKGRRLALPSPDRLVFLSQSRDAEQVAFGIRRFLEMEGHRVWFWRTDGGNAPQAGLVPYPPGTTPKPAEDFPELQAALESAKIYVVLVSREWLKSKFCQEELERAERDSETPVLPVLADPRLCTDERVRKLLDRWPAPYAMASLGAQARWAREQVLERLK